ncbi:Tim44 domain-containing protein [Rhodobacteraceae bacterium]|nr:Tim44 domain-containing protein [Paracoccaceae bacterium]
MNNAVIQLIVLAAIAIFLILRLKSVLGTREGFEKTPEPEETVTPVSERKFEVIEGGPDRDIIDHVPEGSPSAVALGQMKQAEPSFEVAGFLKGARGAYEMILMAFETGDLEKIRPFLSADVFSAFEAAIEQRNARGLTVHANFLGLNDLAMQEATFNTATQEAELSVRFGAELISVAKNEAGEVVEGDPKSPRKQRDIWTFARKMGAADPNWQLVATDG